MPESPTQRRRLSFFRYFGRPIWQRRLIGDAILYIVATLVLNACADTLILYPSNQPVGTPAHKIDVRGPTGSLEIWIARSQGAADDEPQAFVLTFIGNASRAEWDAMQVADQWSHESVEIWAVNYPGYGGSQGNAALSSIAPAALVAFDELKKHAGNRPIFVEGRSIGTTAALYVAAHRPADGVIVHSPPPLRQLIMGQFGWWNLWLAAIPVSLGVPADLDSIENAKHVSAPGVFIITEGDTLVPPAYQQMIIDACVGPKTLIRMPDVGHNDWIPDTVMPQVKSALDELLSKAHANAKPATAPQIRGG